MSANNRFPSKKKYIYSKSIHLFINYFIIIWFTNEHSTVTTNIFQTNQIKFANYILKQYIKSNVHQLPDCKRISDKPLLIRQD